MKNRCQWCKGKNPKYIEYHDKEWGKPNWKEQYLWEMLLLESFQAGLSWECVLNKREDFREAFDHFNLDKICCYDETKVKQLLANEKIIRNQLKVRAVIQNSKIWKQIQQEYGSFGNYLKEWTKDKIIYETNQVTNSLSDKLSKDLQKRGMKFVGSKIIYSYLQAIGVINSHEEQCFLYRK